MPPRTPTPTAPPIVRENWTSPVTTPRRSHVTEPWITTRIVLLAKPMPRPMTAHAAASRSSPGVFTASATPIVPAVMRNDPPTTKRPRADAQQDPATDHRADRPPERHRGDGRACLEWRAAADALDERRHVCRETEQHDAREHRDREPRPDQWVSEVQQVHERLGRSALGTDEQPGEPDRGRDQDRDLRGGPAVERGALGHREQKGRHGRREQHGTEDVEAVPAALEALVEHGPDQHAGEDADGQVDHEHPRPPDRRGDQAAESRSHDGRDAPHRGEQPLHLGALSWLEDVARDREGHRLDRACADPLDRAEHDSINIEDESPHSTEPPTNTAMPKRKTGLRPIMSASLA